MGIPDGRLMGGAGTSDVSVLNMPMFKNVYNLIMATEKDK